MYIRADDEDEDDELLDSVGDDDDDDDNDNGNNDDDGRERLFRLFDGSDSPPSMPLPPRLFRFVIVIVYVVFSSFHLSLAMGTTICIPAIIRKKE